LWVPGLEANQELLRGQDDSQLELVRLGDRDNLEALQDDAKQEHCCSMRENWWPMHILLPKEKGM